MNVKVRKSDPPESKEILAEAIIRISAGMQALQASGLDQEAIVILLQAKTHLPKRDIALVLNSLRRLAGWYCR